MQGKMMMGKPMHGKAVPMEERKEGEMMDESKMMEDSEGPITKMVRKAVMKRPMRGKMNTKY